jgi:hypothetical protein
VPPSNILPATDSFYYVDGGEEGNPYLTVQPELFENCQMQGLLNAQGASRQDLRDFFADTVSNDGYPEILPVQNWLVRGAIREDDMGDGLGLVGLLGGDCRLKFLLTVPSQPGLITRSYRHFFDPEFNRGLDVLGSEYPKAVDWALGYQDSFSSPPLPAEGASRNHYSYLDARNSFWWALTRETSKQHGHPDSVVSRRLDADDRMILWATVFRSLGNVVHLLQDTAQPQHSRLDPHSPKDSPSQQAFEGYTNARVLGGGDVGPFVRGFFLADFTDSQLRVPPIGSYGVQDLNGNSPPISFATPVRFFSNRVGMQGDTPGFLERKGLADYSNRGFFTGGTMPGLEGSNPHQSPPADLDDPDSGYSISSSPCEEIFKVDSRFASAACRHYLHRVPDPVDPVYAATKDELPSGFTLPNAPVAADGVFKNFIMAHGERYSNDIAEVTWSPAVIDTIGNFTIPRAIGYSAGMLDFFFRGELELSSPPEGLYAVVDQGIPHHVEDGLPMDESGHVFGFKAMRVRIRNKTKIDDEGNNTLRDSGTRTLIPQTMHGGTDSTGNPTGRLVAIARYHRNPCYQPDLSGEYVTMPDPDTGEPNPQDRRVPNGCAPEATRSAFQEISVSAPIFLDSEGNIAGGAVGATNPCLNVGNINSGTHGAGADCESEAVLAQFDFSEDPVPINATDLFLQVAYRGPLGLEDDGIAVGIKDIHEPNFISMWNGTDWFNLDGYWVSPAQVGPLPLPYEWQPSTIEKMWTCFGEQTIARLYPQQKVFSRDFFRIAVLSDQETVPVKIYAEVMEREFLRGHTFEFVVSQLSRQMAQEDSSRYPEYPYSPQAIPWYARGTVMGGVKMSVFFSYGQEEVNRTMQALILPPAIGRTAPGIPAQVDARFEASADACHLIPDPAQ